MKRPGFLEYHLIEKYYGSKTANRSGRPYIEHINQGLIILDAMGANNESKRAWCYHPLVQLDEDLVKNYKKVKSRNELCDAHIILLAMEYRRLANSYRTTHEKRYNHQYRDKQLLSEYTVGTRLDVEISPLIEVNQALMADKIQNRYAYERYLKPFQSNMEYLVPYFKFWFEFFQISEETYRNYELILMKEDSLNFV